MQVAAGRQPSIRVLALVVGLLVSGLVFSVSGATADTEIHLTAAGDYGARASTNTVLQKIAQLSPDANLALGDLAYGDATPETAWCNYVKARVGEGFPFELVSGNHESLDVGDGAINNYSACLPNQVPGVVGTYGREYYMDFPRTTPIVRVIQVSPKLTFEDGLWAYSVGDAHYTWLSNAIDDARAKGVKWVIVSAHIPCLSIGVYNCPSDAAFYQLLASKKVDLVLHGHEHAYMRTHQLRSGVTGCMTITVDSFNANCVADDDNAYTAGVGTVFATVGTGGMTMRDVTSTDSRAGYFAAYEGLNLNQTYGLLDLHITDTQLSAQFVGTSGGTFTDSFTITKGPPPPNEPPVAVISTQMQDRTVSADGSNSHDDGTIVSYDWDFGDGSTATGVTPAPHAYAVAGPYTITLTVTDDQGVPNTATTTVNATDPVPNTKVAEDTFTRTLASGWGTADLGGPWSVSNASAFSINGSEGSISTAAGGGRNAYLRGATATEVDARVSLGVNKILTGSGLYVSLVGRSVTGAGDYRAVVRFMADRRVTVRLGRANAAGAETIIGPETVVAGLTYATTDRLIMRMQVTGSAPTTLRVKVWKVGTTEPAGWNLTATDATANLQASGSTGLVTYLSGSATNAPVVLAVDDYLVTNP
jgi:PKD repeat protein